jgi:hypothetical protein
MARRSAGDVAILSLLAVACGLLAGLLVVAAQIAFSDPRPTFYIDDHPVACRAPGTPAGTPPLPICPEPR